MSVGSLSRFRCENAQQPTKIEVGSVIDYNLPAECEMKRFVFCLLLSIFPSESRKSAYPHLVSFLTSFGSLKTTKYYQSRRCF